MDFPKRPALTGSTVMRVGRQVSRMPDDKRGRDKQARDAENRQRERDLLDIEEGTPEPATAND